MLWVLLSKMFPARADWVCWFKWTYDLRLWLAGKRYGIEMEREYRSKGMMS